jgi:hypothetical protein
MMMNLWPFLIIIVVCFLCIGLFLNEESSFIFSNIYKKIILYKFLVCHNLCNLNTVTINKMFNFYKKSILV